MNEDLRFPIGRFSAPKDVVPEDREEWIRIIDALPQDLENAVQDLGDEQLDVPYRPGGWTTRQVVHHLTDSHMNAYVRVRLALTEDVPTIKPYDEGAWAELADARSGPIAPSLTILRGLHERWVRLLTSMSADDWEKAYHHPDSGRTELTGVVALYAWHCRHHIAHITALREREGW